MELNPHPAQAQIRKGRQVLQDLKATNKLSREGEAWLTFALDPFHDKSITGISGIPDGTIGKSVCCSVVTEQNIKKPDSIVGNWACRVTTYPVTSKFNLNNGVINSNVLAQVDTGPNSISMVVIDYVADGDDFPEFSSIGSDYLSIPDAFLKGPFKVGAFGLEMVNTTSDLHKQGLFSAATMNQNSNEIFTIQEVNAGSVVTNYTWGSAYYVRTPPINLAQLTLLPDVCQWEAREGAYSVVPLKGVGSRNPTATPRYPVLVSIDPTANVAENLPCAGPILSNAVIPGFPQTAALSRFSMGPGEIPADSIVWFATGLSPETTLTIRARNLIERYPNDQEPEIVVLATPTASYDPIALEIYSRVIGMMPAAVMFKENPAGEWWQRILGGIADVAGPMLIALPHPLAKAAGAALMVGNKALNPDNAQKKVVIDGSGQLAVQKRNAAKKAKAKAKADKAKRMAALPLPAPR